MWKRSPNGISDDNIPGQRWGEADDEPGGEEERLAEDEDLPAADHVGQEAVEKRADAARRNPRQHWWYSSQIEIWNASAFRI